MYDTEPNVTLILFVFFIIAVSYFLADIFISLVILIYNEVIKMNLKQRKNSNEEILKKTHWTLKIRDLI